MSKSKMQKQPGTALVLKGHTNSVNDVAVTPDGTRAVSTSFDQTLRVWDLVTGKSLTSLEGHTDTVFCVAVTTDGTRAISASDDKTLRVWDLATGKSLASLEGHTAGVYGVAVMPDGTRAVSASYDDTLRVWDLATGKSLASLEGHTDGVRRVAVTPDGTRAVSASADKTLRIWDLATGRSLASLEGHTDRVIGVAVTPDGTRAVSASLDKTLRVWDLATGKSLASLEGHADGVYGVAVTTDGTRAISASQDQTLRVWDLATGKSLASLEGHTAGVWGVAVTPDSTRAVSASYDNTLRVWELAPLRKASYTNAKVLLVGDTGVGKSGLAHRLTTGTPPGQLLSTDAAWATHWSLPHEAKAEHGEREIWLWDFAGQPDYRLAHPLYMDETALAVFVFDPQDRNPLAGLAEWDRMMTRAARKPFAKLLVAGRCDRGGMMISRGLIDQFRQDHRFGPYIESSAQTGLGCDDLARAIVDQIDWDAIPYTVSPDTFRKLKEVIVRIKDRTYSTPKGKKKPTPAPVLLSSDALARMVSKQWREKPKFTEDEFRAVVSLLHGPGVVWKLEFGDLVLLQPERINAYSAALVRKVRKHINEIGVIPEAEVLAGDLEFADMVRLPKDEENIVLRAMHLMVVDRGLCIRHRVPDGRILLVFPSLYKRERPERPSHPLILMTFRFEGHLDEIYATLVVRLHYTDTFKYDKLWLDAAEFESPTGDKIGLKMTRHEGQGEITVFADGNVSNDSRLMFVRYVHEHLKARDPNCVRIRHYVCEKCKQPFGDQATIDRAREDKQGHVFCGRCGKKIVLDDVIERRFGDEETTRQAREMQEQAQAVLDNESKELILVGHSYVIAGEARQIYRQYTNSDHGIDGEIEFKNSKGEAASTLIYLQLKSGDSYLTTRKDGTEIFTIKKPRHVEYWRERKYPVMLVVRTSDGRIRWMDVRAYLQRERDAGREVKQIVFNGEPFTAATVRTMRDKVLGKS
jgi:GTPase SAR1 family protein/DNA-directed RNA polymerase subunit RPC12/RpoP